MITIIVLIVVGITLIGSSIIEWNRDKNRIQELENKLNQYYIERIETNHNQIRNNGVHSV